MKSISLLLIIMSFAACTSHRIDRKIDDASWDSLANESYLRWGYNRLDKVSKSSPAVVECYKGEAKDTLDQYKKEYLTKGSDTYYWLHVGNCYFIENNWNKAEFYYRMSLEESKSLVVKSIALNNLGLLHFKYEQWENGKELLIQSSKIAPKFKVPRFNLSQLYVQFGHYDKAIEILTDKSFQSHKDIDVYFSLANAYFFKGDLKNASHYFKLIPKENFTREDIAATYALYLMKLGDIKGAIQIMNDRDRSNVDDLTAISQKIEKVLAKKMKEE